MRVDGGQRVVSVGSTCGPRCVYGDGRGVALLELYGLCDRDRLYREWGALTIVRLAEGDAVRSSGPAGQGERGPGVNRLLPVIPAGCRPSAD